LTSPDGTANLPDWFLPRVAELLGQSSRLNELQISNTPGGGNNRVYRAELGSIAYLVKWYFSAPEDPRDRLDTEWRFATFAWRHTQRCVAEPIACDPERRLAIFEFVNGRRLKAFELNAGHIRAATKFFEELNRYPPNADRLPVASEACFTIKEHIDCIRGRVQRLVAAINQDDTQTDAAEFVNKALMPTATCVVESMLDQVSRERGVEAIELRIAKPIVSPSDFGFHNALLDENGRMRFIDFEYAGWDDPAKTVCDFFTQVEVPIPDAYWSSFVATVSTIAKGDLAWRAQLLRPLYAVKWCCIVLNPLLKTGRERREFSVGRSVEVEDCLQKARGVLAQVPAP
jgi:hypothetical protein